MAVHELAPELAPESYVLLGVATCFHRTDDGVEELHIAEPIPSAALEALLANIPTSYNLAVATTLEKVLSSDGTAILPPEFPADVQPCKNFAERTVAACRTYQSKPHCQGHIPVGNVFTDFQFSVEKKRVLNPKQKVKDSDNVKQHSHTHKVL
ncbi:MAG: hypothetical protein ACK456_11240 [Pseudanabaenaceae cyanobacterium]|jgi:hypothetical protein